MRPLKNIVWHVALAALVIGLWWPAPTQAQGPWWGPYPYPYRYGYDPGAAIRLDVRPRETQVYVDGYYAGVVDDFDGVFQRLLVEPGEHEITLYLEGHRTWRQRMYATLRHTFKIRHTMERLAAGEQQEPPPEPINPPQPQSGAQPPSPGPRPPVRRMPPPQTPPPTAPRGQQTAAYGTLAIRVQPSDAEILIDGELWTGPAIQDQLAIEVTEGRHTIEVRKTGYRTYVTDVQIRRGETTTLNVSLRTPN